MVKKDKSKECRGYQEKAIYLCEETGDLPVSIEHPTGSGKTLVGAVVAVRQANLSKFVVLATTQKNIESSFVSYSEVLTSRFTVDCGDMKLARAGNSSAAAVISDTLADGKRKPDAWVTTHATVARLDISKLPKSLKGVVFIIDEAHHAGLAITKLGRVIKEVHARGGKVISLTATAYRSDYDELMLPNTETDIRTLAEHMRDGCCPTSVDMDWLPYRVDDITDELFFGDDGSDEQLDGDHVAILIKRMLTVWSKTGRPKTIIRVPSMPSGALRTITRVCEMFAARGARVLNASGECSVNEQPIDLFEELEGERKRGKYAKSQYDVIVGCNRVVEGMDWPYCSDVYCVGVPRSTRVVEQLLGRTMRKKDSTCPMPFRERSSMRFFLPCRTNTGFDGLSKKQAEHVIYVCGTIQDKTNSALWVALDGKYRRLQTVPASTVKDRKSWDESSREWQRIKQMFVLANKDIEDSGGKPTPKAVREWLLAPEFGLTAELVDVFLKSITVGRRISPTAITGLPDGFDTDGVRQLASDLDAEARIPGKFKNLVLRLSHSLLSEYGERAAKLADPVLPGMDAFQKFSRRLHQRRS